MGRKLENGFDYFSVDADILNDGKVILLLESDGGHEAFGVWLGLLSKICEHGCCLKFDEEHAEETASLMRMSLDSLVENLWIIFDRRLFSYDIYSKTGYLTSKTIQKRYFQRAVLTRRKTAQLPESILLINPPDEIEIMFRGENLSPIPSLLINKKVESKIESKVNPQITGDSGNLQENTGNSRKLNPGFREGTVPHGTFLNVFLKAEELLKLESDFGKATVTSKIESLSASIENKQRKYLAYKNHAATIRNWCNMAMEKTNSKIHERELAHAHNKREYENL